MTTPSKADQIPYRGIGTDGTQKQIIQFWDRLIGAFFKYLAYSAMRYLDPEKGRVSYDTATRYASAVKTYFCNKFKHEGPPLTVFQMEDWRRLRCFLLRKYKKSNKQTGKKLVNSRFGSTIKDRKAMACNCFWISTIEGAEFHCLNTAQFQLAGRGSEVALLKVEDIYCIDSYGNFTQILFISSNRVF
ncbi:hypothetical protein ACA910_020560 [Epithemia clementina (nom. ined.)]